MVSWLLVVFDNPMRVATLLGINILTLTSWSIAQTDEDYDDEVFEEHKRHIKPPLWYDLKRTAVLDPRILRPLEKYLNNYIARYLRGMNQNGQHKYRIGMIGKRGVEDGMEKSIDDDELKHLSGFGFSKHGKRLYYEVQDNDLEELQSLAGFGFSRYGKRTPTEYFIQLCEDDEKKKDRSVRNPVVLHGFSFTNFGQQRLGENTGNMKQFQALDDNIKLIKREIDKENMKYLEGFGFSLGQLGKRSRRKRDSIVGISQWGKKRSVEISNYPMRFD